MMKDVQEVLAKAGEGEWSLSPEEELQFYREILSKLRAFVYVNQVDDLDDLRSSHMIWLNKECEDSMGYSLKEVREMGFALHEKITVPDDNPVMTQSLDFHKLRKGDSYGGLARFYNKDHESHWYLGRCCVLSEKKGKPWQFLNVALDIQNEFHSQEQVFEMQNEILRLRHQIALSTLTHREKEVLTLIAHGKTDKEIARKLQISDHTARTHRKNILKKLDKRNGSELTVFAKDCGLV